VPARLPAPNLPSPSARPTFPLSCTTGAVYAEEGSLNKADGRRVERIGPLKNWSMTPATGNATTGPIIRITTQMGCYLLSRPLPAYKKVWAELQAQAALTSEIMLVSAHAPMCHKRPRPHPRL
jgi:hypothetical protein